VSTNVDALHASTLRGSGPRPLDLEEEMTFTLATDAKIMAGPKAKNLGDLKVGERVKVSYLDEGKSHRAQRIDVVSPGRVAEKLRLALEDAFACLCVAA
jgi:hypothetical protein